MMKQQHRAVLGLRGLTLLHDNAPAHTSSVVTVFHKVNSVTVLSHTLLAVTSGYLQK